MSARYCPGQGGMKHLYGKNSRDQAGIPVAKTEIPARWDGTENVPPPYKQYAIKAIETYACLDPGHRAVPINVRSASLINRPQDGGYITNL